MIATYTAYLGLQDNAWETASTNASHSVSGPNQESAVRVIDG